MYSAAESTVPIKAPVRVPSRTPNELPNGAGRPVLPAPSNHGGRVAAIAVSPLPVGVSPLPGRAAGLQLLGRYEGSGFREDHFLAARDDGQVVHLSSLLYHVLAELAPGRSADDVARMVSSRVGKQLGADGVCYLIEKKLQPSGLVEAVLPAPGPPGPAGPSDRPTAVAKPGASAAKAAKANPLLALRLHRVILSERATGRAARLLKFLFAPVAIALCLVGLLVTDALLVTGGAAQTSLLQVITDPLQMLAVLGLLLGGTLFHEFGHAAGCRYGGGRPGVIGVGVYVILPAFYTNVTDAYRLDRAGRLRTDLGGIYFNAIAAMMFGVGYLATGWVPLLLGAFLMHLEALQQCLPLIRSDGYFILADLVGVPDLFGRIRPVLASLLPWRAADPRVRELRPRVRVVISAWVLVVVPVLGAAMIYLFVQTPTIVASSVSSVLAQWQGLIGSVGSGSWAAAVLAFCAIVMLLVPLAGLSIFIVRFAGQLAALVVRLVRAWHTRSLAHGRHSFLAVHGRTSK